MSFRMTSYADNFEDVLLQRAFGMDYQGFFIDVGAYHPVEHSVTKHFSDRGWWGLNIEPNPAPFALLATSRDRDINLNIGLSDAPGELTLFEAPGACWSVDVDLLTGYFGANRDDLVVRTIPVRTLAEVCDRHVPHGTPIDFLKVDVEGHERAVLEGGDWHRHRPRIILAESNGFEAWEPLLFEAGYHFTLFDGVNRFYVRDEDARLIPLLSVPVNASDSFSIFGYVHRIDELEDLVFHQARELDRYRGVGPGALRVARGIGSASKRFPAAARIAKRFVGLARGA